MALANIRKVVKKHSNRTDAIAKLGLKEQELTEALAYWLGSPCKLMFEAAQEVVSGKPRTPLAKLLAVERELTLNALGRRKRITLYRGVNGSYALKIKAAMKKRKRIPIPLKRAQSWTDNINIARNFGSIVLTADIPTQYVVACYRTNRQIEVYRESEYIVAIPNKTLMLPRSQIKINDHY